MSRRSTRSSLTLSGLLCAVLVTALGSTSHADTSGTSNLACGTQGTPATAEAGTTVTVSGASSHSCWRAALFAMFGLSAHPGCEDCPPEKPMGCDVVSPASGYEMTTTENPDGTFTVTLVAGANAQQVHKCYNCYGEEPL